MTIFYDAASSMDLVVLMALRDVDLIHTYDWGSDALAYLYWGMDEFVRGAHRFCGFWHAIHVCFLTLLTSFYYSHYFLYFLFNKNKCRFGALR